MKKILIINLLISLFVSTIVANNINDITNDTEKTDANVTGHVVNAKTHEHLPYILVGVKGTNIGVTTDATGHYTLKNLPIGDLTLVVKSMGYKTVEKKVSTKKNTLKEVNFEIQEDEQMLDEIVVSATKNETNKRSAPIIVNVASQKLFATTASCNLTDVMNFQPGLRIENNCGNCGTTQLRINGLDGQYSQILLDSRPIFSSLAGVYGLEQLPTAMIERVEVVRGGGSALFGGSAIGGVVNIITKEPLRNSATISNTTNMFSDGKLDINTALNGSFVSDDHKMGVYIFGMLRNRENYDKNKDGFSDVPKINSETLGFRSFYHTTDYSQLILEYHHIHEFRRGGNNFNKPPHEADIAEQLDHKIDGGGLTYKMYTRDGKQRWNIFTSGQLIKRDSYFGINKNLDSYGDTEDKTFVSGTQYAIDIDKLFFMPATFTTGFEYNYNYLHDTFDGLGRDLKQISKTYGGYIQNEWKTETLSLLVGTRIDKQNFIDNVIFAPRANVRYSPNKNISFRGSYASGYRAPQAYNEDLHVEAVGGSLSMIELDKNLKPEYSHSLSASIDFYHNFGVLQTNFLIEGFYTTLKDVFTLDRTGQNEDESITYWVRKNGSGAKIKGLTLEGKMGIPSVGEVQFGYTFQNSKYNDPEKWSDDLQPQRKMFRSPNQYGYITLNYYVTPRFTTSVFGTYTGKMLVKHTINDGVETYDKEVNTPTFWDMGAKLAYNFKLTSQTSIEINGGVKNIFDAYQKDLDYGINKDASYVYGPAMPRMIFMGLKLSL